MPIGDPGRDSNPMYEFDTPAKMRQTHDRCQNISGACTGCGYNEGQPGTHFLGCPTLGRSMDEQPNTNGALRDGGDRTTFSTGSQRDTQDGKPRPDLLPIRAALRKSIIHMLGSIKYEERNWEKGQPQSQFVASLMRHLFKWMLGDTTEDHLAQAAWNLDALLDQEERYYVGQLPGELLDLPHYGGNNMTRTVQLAELPTRVYLLDDAKKARKAALAFRDLVKTAKSGAGKV